MAIGFGQGSAMTKSVNSNRGQMRKRKFLNTDSKDVKLKEKELKYNEFTDEERQKFREKLALDKKRENTKKMIYMGLLVALFLGFIYWFNF